MSLPSVTGLAASDCMLMQVYTQPVNIGAQPMTLPLRLSRALTAIGAMTLFTAYIASQPLQRTMDRIEPRTSSWLVKPPNSLDLCQKVPL